MNTHPTSFLS